MKLHNLIHKNDFTKQEKKNMTEMPLISNETNNLYKYMYVLQS